MKYLIIAFVLIACDNPAKETRRSSNSNIKVELLLEVDGCKVYRFYDNGKKYFTNCKGATSWSETRGSGKHTTVIDYEIPNN